LPCKFSDAFFNIYQEGRIVYIESTCGNISCLAEQLEIGGVEEEGDGICRVAPGVKKKEEAVTLLKRLGVPETKIAVENEPLQLEVESGFSGRRVLVCPVCGSTEIVVANVAGLMPTLYRCLRCGYIGRIVLEVELPAGSKDGSG